MRAAELIQACYARLNTASVTGLLSQEYGVPAVFQVGRVPQAESGDPVFFPYVVITIVSDVDFSDKLALGGDAILQVSIFDRSGSKLIGGNILRAVSLATVRQEWAVPGFIHCEREMSEGPRTEADGLTMQTILRLRVRYLDTGNPWSSEFSAEFG